MRTTLFSATIVAGLVALFAVADLRADRNNPAPASNVAVVDFGYIFKNHQGLKQLSEALKAEQEDIGAKLQAEKKSLTSGAEKLKTLKAGSPEFKKLEEELVQREADLKVQASLQKKTIFEKDTQNMYRVLREVNEEIKAFAQKSNIAVVLQYSADPIDPANPNSVAGALSRGVVYQDQLDISDIILKELNRRSAGAVSSRPRNKQN